MAFHDDDEAARQRKKAEDKLCGVQTQKPARRFLRRVADAIPKKASFRSLGKAAKLGQVNETTNRARPPITHHRAFPVTPKADVREQSSANWSTEIPRPSAPDISEVQLCEAEEERPQQFRSREPSKASSGRESKKPLPLCPRCIVFFAPGQWREHVENHPGKHFLCPYYPDCAADLTSEMAMIEHILGEHPPGWKAQNTITIEKEDMAAREEDTRMRSGIKHENLANFKFGRAPSQKSASTIRPEIRYDENAEQSDRENERFSDYTIRREERRSLTTFTPDLSETTFDSASLQSQVLGSDETPATSVTSSTVLDRYSMSVYSTDDYCKEPWVDQMRKIYYGKGRQLDYEDSESESDCSRLERPHQKQESYHQNVWFRAMPNIKSAIPNLDSSIKTILPAADDDSSVGSIAFERIRNPVSRRESPDLPPPATKPQHLSVVRARDDAYAKLTGADCLTDDESVDYREAFADFSSFSPVEGPSSWRQRGDGEMSPVRLDDIPNWYPAPARPRRDGFPIREDSLPRLTRPNPFTRAYGKPDAIDEFPPPIRTYAEWAAHNQNHNSGPSRSGAQSRLAHSRSNPHLRRQAPDANRTRRGGIYGLESIVEQPTAPPPHQLRQQQSYRNLKQDTPRGYDPVQHRQLNQQRSFRELHGTFAEGMVNGRRPSHPIRPGPGQFGTPSEGLQHWFTLTGMQNDMNGRYPALTTYGNGGR